jgi:Co/Zn/Cd efflux system component
MGAACCGHGDQHPVPEHQNQAYRQVLWTALGINAAMFVVELGMGLRANSASLQADALDFLGDAVNYALSLFVVGMAQRFRASAALAKGASMGVLGCWVLGVAGWHLFAGTVPQAITMGAVGLMAVAANGISFALLWAYRMGDANMRSAWICTRNDLFGNCAVLLASLGVFGTGSGWPDLAVAAIMALLALQGASVVVRHSLREFRSLRAMNLTQPARGAI